VQRAGFDAEDAAGRTDDPAQVGLVCRGERVHVDRELLVVGRERFPRPITIARRQQRPGALVGNVRGEMTRLEELFDLRWRPARRPR